MKKLSTLLTLLFIGISRGSAASDTDEMTQPVKCATGTATYLEEGGRARSMEMDGPEGESRFLLRSKTNAAVLWKDDLSDSWLCLGYNSVSGDYVLAGMHTQGASEPIDEIVYVSEKMPAIRASAFTQEIYRAFAILLSPSGRYLIFVGGKTRNNGLFAIDTQTDKIRRLGEAPAPPPLAPEALANVDGGDQWGWDIPAASLRTVEPDILRFDGDAILKASSWCGKDTFRSRAKQRDIKTWDLSTLFAQEGKMAAEDSLDSKISYLVSGGPPPGASRHLWLIERDGVQVFRAAKEGLDASHAHYLVETFEMSAQKQDIQELRSLLTDKNVFSAPLSAEEQEKEKHLIIDGAQWKMTLSEGKNSQKRVFFNSLPAFAKPFEKKVEALIAQVLKDGSPVPKSSNN